ncbi:hypothetical protein QOT17_015759 [Balamuthia mandrillaris]
MELLWHNSPGRKGFGYQLRSCHRFATLNLLFACLLLWPSVPTTTGAFGPDLKEPLRTPFPQQQQQPLPNRHHAWVGGRNELATFAAPGDQCSAQCKELRKRAPGEALNVTVGASVTGVTGVAVTEEFWMKGIYWMYWETCVSLTISDSEETPQPFLPYQNIGLLNQWEVWGAFIEPKCDSMEDGIVTCPICSTPYPGYSYAAYFFTANLATNFSYNLYPLDSQPVFVRLGNINYAAEDVKLILDSDSNVNLDVGITGFVVGDTIARTITLSRKSHFGLGKDSHQLYNAVEIGAMVTRETRFFYFKVLPPALITLVVSVLVLFLEPEEVGNRLSVALTGLLTEVLIGLSFDGRIPDVGSVTIIDWLFNWCYCLLFLVVLECIVMSVWLNRRRKRPIHNYLGFLGKLLCCNKCKEGKEWLEEQVDIAIARRKLKKQKAKLAAKLARTLEMELLSEAAGDLQDDALSSRDLHIEQEEFEERRVPDDLWCAASASTGGTSSDNLLSRFSHLEEEEMLRLEERRRKGKLARRIDFFVSLAILLASSVGTWLVIYIALTVGQ